jgi:hypothetical protein
LNSLNVQADEQVDIGITSLVSKKAAFVIFLLKKDGKEGILIKFLR